jgi:hypothetical protein
MGCRGKKKLSCPLQSPQEAATIPAQTSHYPSKALVCPTSSSLMPPLSGPQNLAQG